MIPRSEPLEGFRVLDRETGDRAATLKLSLGDASPFVSGHFPSEAILPGVAHLGLALHAAEGLQDPSAILSGVRELRLRQIVRPGDVIDVTVTRATAEGEFRFEVRKGNLLASSGILTFRPDDGR